jgi:hypothetical protein
LRASCSFSISHSPLSGGRVESSPPCPPFPHISLPPAPSQLTDIAATCSPLSLLTQPPAHRRTKITRQVVPTHPQPLPPGTSSHHHAAPTSSSAHSAHAASSSSSPHPSTAPASAIAAQEQASAGAGPGGGGGGRVREAGNLTRPDDRRRFDVVAPAAQKMASAGDGRIFNRPTPAQLLHGFSGRGEGEGEGGGHRGGGGGDEGGGGGGGGFNHGEQQPQQQPPPPQQQQQQQQPRQLGRRQVPQGGASRIRRAEGEETVRRSGEELYADGLAQEVCVCVCVCERERERERESDSPPPALLLLS